MLNNISLPCDILVHDIDKLSYAEWLQIRKSGIGGSDAAAAIGLSPWKSRHELWREKLSNEPSLRTDNDAMLWGRLLEPLIRDEFVNRSGMAVNPLRSMLKHPCFPWMLADLDGIVEDPKRGLGVLEIKTASAYKASEWEDGRCPDHYMLQLQHYMTVAGLDFAIIAVLIGGNKFQWTTVEKDDEIIDNLVELERRFWQYVLCNTPPPVDGSTACAEMLARKYPAASNKAPLILNSEADLWVQNFLAASVEEDAAAEKKRLAESNLKSMMQNHERAVTSGGVPVTWKNVTSSRLDSKKPKADHPELAVQYSNESTARRFAVGMPGGK